MQNYYACNCDNISALLFGNEPRLETGGDARFPLGHIQISGALYCW